MSAGLPATKVVGCGETNSRVLASCAASSPDTACRETVACRPIRGSLVWSTVVRSNSPRSRGVLCPETQSSVMGTGCDAGLTVRGGGAVSVGTLFFSPPRGAGLTVMRHFFARIVRPGAITWRQHSCKRGAQVTTRPRPVMRGRSRAVTRPGGDATTAGTALTRRMAVALSPAVLWSPSVPMSCRSRV
jgi:hypothetical protein